MRRTGRPRHSHVVQAAVAVAPTLFTLQPPLQAPPMAVRSACLITVLAVLAGCAALAADAATSATDPVTTGVDAVDFWSVE